jgi:hypothetical protein
MKVRFYILTAILLAATAVACAENAPVQAGEYQIKAAFLYNFIKFSEWPESKVAESNTLTIGLLGEHQFKDTFDAVKDKPVGDKRLIIKKFGKFTQFTKADDSGKLQFTAEIEQLRKCHLLFICDSEQKYYKEIINATTGSNVLTVGETVDFLDFGGIITFIPGTEKPVFDINSTAAKDAKITISSRVLRLARKVKGAESVEHSEMNPFYAYLAPPSNNH